MIKEKLNKNTVHVEYEQISIVDQFPAQGFNITPWGTIRNDLAALAMAQDINEFNAIVARLGEVKESDQFKGMNDEQILQHICPRFMQDPSELERFGEYIGQLDKIEYERFKAAQTIAENSVDNTIVEQDKAPE